jgi:hypothetical protein
MNARNDNSNFEIEDWVSKNPFNSNANNGLASELAIRRLKQEIIQIETQVDSIKTRICSSLEPDDSARLSYKKVVRDFLRKIGMEIKWYIPYSLSGLIYNLSLESLEFMYFHFRE